ncbi:MAG: hypothetical protein ACXABV_16530 [Candidatus Thorarchaeota archaeon]
MLRTRDHTEISMRLDEAQVEALMTNLFSKYKPIYSKAWENDGFKIEFLFSYILEGQIIVPIIAIVERGPNDDDCEFRFYGPEWEAERISRGIEIKTRPSNWGTCYHCGASYFYFEESVLEGRMVECQNCTKVFKLDYE